MLAEETTSVASDRRVFSAGEDAGGLEHIVAGEQEQAEHLPRLGRADVGSGGHHVLGHRPRDVGFSCSCA